MRWPLAHGLDVVAGQRRLLVAVAHAETAAKVEVANADAAHGQAIDQRQQAIQCIEEGRQGGQLRADMAVDANHFQVAQFVGARIHRFGIGDGDAELVLLEPGGNVRMGAGIHVRIDAQRHRGDDAQLGGDQLQTFELVGGFDVEAMHAHFQRTAHVIAGLADAGEDDALGLSASGEHALQFAARDDVEARTEARQDVEHAEVGVGFHREADQMRHARQRVGIGPILRFDVRAGVDVGGGAEALCESGQCHALREELTVAVREGLHDDASFTVRIGLWSGL